MRRALLLALLLVAACGPSRAALRPGDAARLGERFDLTALDLGGRPRSVAELAAGRVVLVDVWATWCRPCHDALLAWEGLRERFGGRVAVVGISIDADPRQLPRFFEDTRVTFPILWDRAGAEALSLLELEKVPTVLLLDRQGRVRHVHEGWYGRDTVETIEGELETLLSEQPHGGS